MAVRNQPLTPVQLERFKSAQALVRDGNGHRALGIARALVEEAPRSADAQLLLAMVLAERDESAASEAAFRRALALVPDSQVVSLNFAAWLRRRGRLEEAMATLESCPESAQVRTQQGLIALQAGEPGRARARLERALALQPGSVTAWHGLGNALRALAEWEAAEQAFRKVVTLRPDGAPGWFGLGAVLRLLGRVAEALVCLRRAQALGLDSPELLNAINGTLYDLGRASDALVGARDLIERYPGHVQGHEMLANLQWESGAGPDEDPLAQFRQAASLRPGDLDLQLGLARMLLSVKRPGEALTLLQTIGRRAQHPLLGWYLAEAQSALGQVARASALFEAAGRTLGDSVAFLNAHARHAFRAGEPDRAAACASRAVALDPRHPEAWSHLGTAWRLAGDEREYWLFGYDTLIGYVEVPPPQDFPDPPSFLAALKRTLESLHLAGREPVEQSVRGGSQTPGRLFGRDDATLQAAERSLRASVEDWLATLPRVSDHPFLSRVGGGVRFAGSWSVRLRSSGRHANHIHTEGWLSSAFYVSLPAAIGADTARPHAGWIQFGQPLEELGLDLAPRRLLRPRPGYLALFPSYMWHGTIPFTDTEPRLTIAFDMQPVPGGRPATVR